LQKKPEAKKKSSCTCTKHGNPVVDYDSFLSVEDVPCSIYNCAEARLQFRILVEGMEEEQEEEESEPQIPDYDEYNWEEDD
jgi:hypothetical protein